MAVDKLHHADHLLLKIGQRECQHGARAIACRLVEGLIEIKRYVFRDRVEIVDEHRFAGRRDIAGNRGWHDGNAEIGFA